jgi:hypothetical protein
VENSGPKIALWKRWIGVNSASQEMLMNSRFAGDSVNWRRLCRAAVLEQDADKLSHIVRRMNSALGVHQQRLRDLAKAKRDTISSVSPMPDRAA